MIPTREAIFAEAERVSVPITVLHWYVTHEEAEAILERAIKEGAIRAELSSPEGWNIEISAMDGGRRFCKRAQISPTSCLGRALASDFSAACAEAKYQVYKRSIELKRDIAFFRLRLA